MTMKLKSLIFLVLINISLMSGQSGFGPEQIISTTAYQACYVYACDIDGDGDNDVLSACTYDNKIAWYENTDGNGSFSGEIIITTLACGASSVFACDLDNDNDNDVISASTADDKLAWYENTDGFGNFGQQQIISDYYEGACHVYACDIDQDNDIDILLASIFDNNLSWFENIDGNGNFSTHILISNNVDAPTSIYACDLDGDGDYDVLSASCVDDKVAWYENTNGEGTFGAQKIISTNTDYVRSVYACDIDGDSDNDVLSASAADDKIAWFENIDGNGTFSSERIISNSADYAYFVYAEDIDNDGDKDVLSASMNDNKIAWYENTDGLGTFGEQKIISTSAHETQCVFAIDIDGDGDNDVLSASWDDNKIAWYENIDNVSKIRSLQKHVHIYPNPTNRIVNIEFTKNNIKKITVSDITGKLIFQKTSADKKETKQQGPRS